MATRVDLDVTLRHEDAKEVREMLSQLARDHYSHARRTRSAAVRESVITQAAKAEKLAQLIVRSLWDWR